MRKNKLITLLMAGCIFASMSVSYTQSDAADDGLCV